VKNQLAKLSITGGSCILIVFTGVMSVAKRMDLDPDLAFAYTIQGVVRAELVDDRQGAIDSYNQAIQLQPDRAINYYFRAKNRSRSGNDLGAIDDFNKAIRLQPDYVNAYISRGVVRANIGKIKEAISDYNKAAELFKKKGKTKDYQEALDRSNKLSTLKNS
jgi:tetratricopeptide (TPR) repeat protein